MSPLRHTVRLVDREQGDDATVEQVSGGRHAKPLRREVEQIELSGDEGGLDAQALVAVLSRVKEGGPDADSGQRIDLILHEGD